MPVSKIDNTFNKLFFRLSQLQKRAVIRCTRQMLGVKLTDTRQTFKEYNLEVDRAIQNVNQGNFTTLEDLEKEMESW